MRRGVLVGLMAGTLTFVFLVSLFAFTGVIGLFGVVVIFCLPVALVVGVFAWYALDFRILSTSWRITVGVLLCLALLIFLFTTVSVIFI